MTPPTIAVRGRCNEEIYCVPCMPSDHDELRFPGPHRTHRSPQSKTLQDPQNVAETMRYLLRLPADTAVPEMTVIPMRETSWP